MGNSRGNSEFSVMVELFVKMIQSFLGQPLEVIIAELWLLGVILFVVFYFKMFMVFFIAMATIISITVLLENIYENWR